MVSTNVLNKYLTMQEKNLLYVQYKKEAYYIIVLGPGGEINLPASPPNFIAAITQILLQFPSQPLSLLFLLYWFHMPNQREL